jgi:putative transposase
VWYNLDVSNRDYKGFERGEIYHLYNRGVGKMQIFNDEEDYKVFLYRLWENLYPELADKIKKKSRNDYRRKELPPLSFDLICYCLMPNHFHLLIKQNTDLPLTNLISKICTGYSKYFNKKYERVGSLFQDQFKAVRIETNEQLLWTSIYIHQNPIKAELVDNLSKYKWNSFLDYSGLQPGNLCKKELILGQYNSLTSYLSCIIDKKLNAEINNKMVSCLDILLDNFE